MIRTVGAIVAAVLVGFLAGAWCVWSTTPEPQPTLTLPPAEEQIAEITVEAATEVERDRIVRTEEAIDDMEAARAALCVALDEIGRDSTSQTDVEACTP